MVVRATNILFGFKQQVYVVVGATSLSFSWINKLIMVVRVTSLLWWLEQ